MLCGLFYEAICCMSCIVLVFSFFFLCVCVCVCVCVLFSPLSVAFTSLGKKRANLGAFRTFVRFALVWFCFLFLFMSRMGCGLWLWYSLDFSLTFFPCPEKMCLNRSLVYKKNVKTFSDKLRSHIICYADQLPVIKYKILWMAEDYFISFFPKTEIWTPPLNISRHLSLEK